MHRHKRCNWFKTGCLGIACMGALIAGAAWSDEPAAAPTAAASPETGDVQSTTPSGEQTSPSEPAVRDGINLQSSARALRTKAAMKYWDATLEARLMQFDAEQTNILQARWQRRWQSGLRFGLSLLATPRESKTNDQDGASIRTTLLQGGLATDYPVWGTLEMPIVRLGAALGMGTVNKRFKSATAPKPLVQSDYYFFEPFIEASLVRWVGLEWGLGVAYHLGSPVDDKKLEAKVVTGAAVYLAFSHEI